MKTFGELREGDKVYYVDLTETCIRVFQVIKIEDLGYENRLRITFNCFLWKKDYLSCLIFNSEDHYRYNIWADREEAIRFFIKNANLKLKELANDIDFKISIYEKIERTIQQYKNEID